MGAESRVSDGRVLGLVSRLVPASQPGFSNELHEHGMNAHIAESAAFFLLLLLLLANLLLPE